MSQPKPGGYAFGGLAVGREDGCSDVGGGWLLGPCHELERGLVGGGGASVVQEFGEEGLGVETDIGGGGEDSGVARDSAHAACSWVVDRTSQEAVEVGVYLCIELVIVSGGCDVGNPVLCVP